jgi:ketosteroid isomerase-like protein
MSIAVELVLRHVELAQKARREQTVEAWDAVQETWDPKVEIRIAGSRSGGALWRAAARGRDAARERLSRPEVNASRLTTRTVRAFQSADGALVVVEQVSEVTDPDGTIRSLPVCHVFEVRDGLITRQSVYRNEA